MVDRRREESDAGRGGGGDDDDGMTRWCVVCWGWGVREVQ